MNNSEEELNELFEKYDDHTDQLQIQKDLYYSIEAIRDQALTCGTPYTNLKIKLAARYADQPEVLADLKAVSLIAADVMLDTLSSYSGGTCSR
jgi:hypothetical protein